MEELLATKLFIPSIRQELVSRPRLIEQLNSSLDCRLTLISAPAGFGKTTLVGEWVSKLRKVEKKESQVDYKIAWLSLDDGDNDLSRFLAYFIAALNHVEGIDVDLGKGVAGMLRASELPQAETVLTSLINEIAAIPVEIVFILDDCHLINDQPIYDALNFLLENIPPNLHLVIATREDPLLPISRLRTRSQLSELRAVDLRFTNDEAVEFLNKVMSLNLSARDIVALERRTEGWIAGLQLAAISLQGKEDTSQVIKSFSGSYRLVLDYLIEEVLEQQPENTQIFLLQTSILNRLTGPLCDALTGQDNGQQTLESLDRANLFIVPLDENRRWYRYHHLFADLLRRRLHQQHPEQTSKLHLSASEWYEQKSLWSDAIHHAFASDDLERVADLIETVWIPMNTNYQSVTWFGWAKILPDELVRSRPALSTACGWASLDTGDLNTAERYFRDAEQWLEARVNALEQLGDSSNKTGIEKSRSAIVLNDEKLRVLSTSITNGRAYLAQALGDVADTVMYAQRATELLREDEYFERGLSDILIGFGYWASGELDAAYKAVADAISNMQLAGKISFVISFTSYLADILVAQGRLRETEKTYLQLLEFVSEQDESEAPEKAVLHLGLSELYFEQGNMEAAMRQLQSGEELGEQPAFPPWYRHWVCARARVRMSLGNLDGVLDLFKGAKRLYYRHPIPAVRPLTALIAKVQLAQGKLTEVQRWAYEQELSVDDDLNYLHEFEHITFARLLIAQYKNEPVDNLINDAMKLLERLLKVAEDAGRLGSVIEILVAQALAFEAQNEISSALVPLERAMKLAEPEGYFRTFIDEGPPMGHLLYQALSHEIAPAYVQRLLAVFPAVESEKTDISQTKLSEFDLIEPLSERELEILKLLADGLTNQEIGAQLYLSLNTIKAHTRNIYGKLGVKSRTQAAARARSLGILLSS